MLSDREISCSPHHVIYVTVTDIVFSFTFVPLDFRVNIWGRILQSTLAQFESDLRGEYLQE